MENNINEELLDSLAVECGEPVSSTEEAVIINNKDVLEKAVDNTVNKYAYDDGLVPMPGEVITPTIAEKPTDKDAGINTLIAQTAMMKLEKEKEDEARKAAEKVERKKDLVAQLMYQQEEMYFIQNKFRMNGKQKRNLRRIIEKKVARGEFDYLMSDSIPLN